ncbi:hypothetical protein ACQR09_32035 [Bradyrhizobium oligotrophicum]|uniref:hypothetical protein n=1 Tax=Bradyrhizobium oligotrophicum TaxID=44255 RepID=UPI003EBA3CD9
MLRFQQSPQPNSIDVTLPRKKAEPLSSDLLVRYAADSTVHLSMLQKVSPNETYEPLIYKRIYGRSSPTIDEGPAASALASVKKRYDEIERRLDALANADGEEAVERGAVQTAIAVLNQIEIARLPPPKIATQDHEAIIMLWAEGMKRCAITITDGEVGYVVRDNRQLLTARDSINIHEFKLLGQTPA